MPLQAATLWLANMASVSKGSPQDNGSSLLRSILSLMLVLHFICVFTVLGSTFRRSELQYELIRIFRPYTELTHFDPGVFTPFHYTLGRPIDDDAYFEIDLYPDGDAPVANQQLLKTVSLPEGGSRWLSSRRRYIALAKLLAVNANPENELDEVTAEIARGVGGRMMRENNARRAVVRCIQRSSQPPDLAELLPGFPRDNPRAEPYNIVVYEADVWLTEDSVVPEVLKRASRSEVAPRQSGNRATPQSGAGS